MTEDLQSSLIVRAVMSRNGTRNTVELDHNGPLVNSGIVGLGRISPNENSVARGLYCRTGELSIRRLGPPGSAPSGTSLSNMPSPWNPTFFVRFRSVEDCHRMTGAATP